VTENKADYDPEREERGVNGRNIVVLRNDTQGNGYISKSTNPEENKAEHMAGSVSPSASSNDKKESVESFDHVIKPPSPNSSPPRAPSFHREITFAEEVKSSDTDNTESRRIPPRLSAEQHIAFLENQRNPKEKGTLRIPGPREFDRGDMPETLDQGGQSDDQHDKMEEVSVLNSNEHPVKRNITIDEPDHPRPRKRTSTFPTFSLRRLGSSNQHPSMERTNSSAQMRRRSGTFSSNKSSQTREGEREQIPYLSWQPTIGRNSAFVDLTEEQREELGGIEYRALKTLALVLVCE